MVTTSDGTLLGNANGKYVTDRAGTILIENLDPNLTLVVKETRAKTGYILDDVPQTIKTKLGETIKLEFRNKKQGNLVIHKLSSADKSPIEGAQFKITCADGKVVDATGGQLSSNGLYTSNKEGQIVLSNVTGTIICTEVSSAPGCAIDPETRTQTIVVNPGVDTQQIYFYNTPLCSLTLSKVDSVMGKPIPNTTFTVKYASGELIGRYTTGKDRTVTVTGLLPGSTVVVIEYKVPGTHVLNTTPQTITLKTGKNTVTSGAVSGGTGGGNNLDFENDPKMTLTIRKYIKGANREPLAGVCFKVTEGSGTPVGPGDGTYYTNFAGEIVIEGLEPGTTVTAREISTLEGFVLDGEPKTVKIQAGKQAPELIFWNERAGGIVIKKLDSVKKKPLSGVQFQLIYANGSYVDADNGHLSSKGLYTTDQNGEIRLTGIVGTIIISETKPLDGYVVDPVTQNQTVQVNASDTQYITVYNTPIGEYTTDDQGYIYIDDLTVQGKGRLYIRELEAAPGYELDKEYKTIYLQPGKTVEIERENTPTTGQFQIRKYAAEYNEVTGTPAGAPLKGAVYEISEARSGKVVDYITTDARGVAASKPLLLGRYFIKEVTAPPYWQLSGTTFDETLEYSG